MQLIFSEHVNEAKFIKYNNGDKELRRFLMEDWYGLKINQLIKYQNQAFIILGLSLMIRISCKPRIIW